MLFSFRITALLIALTVASLTTIILLMIKNFSTQNLVSIWVTVFFASWLFIYLAYRYIIINEIKKIRKMLERIRKGDIGYLKSASKGHRDLLMQSINEIYSIANIQQTEINELKKMEAYRREFLADVSHELKTPLFAAQGFVHTLLDGAVKDKSVRIKFLKKAAKSLAGLDKLVQDLMIISQMEAGFVKMRYTNFNIFELVEDVFEQFDGKANKKELSLCYSENTSRDAMVYADRERIFQVMINLVSNGIKYAIEKGGKVMVGIIPREGQIEIEVSDDGIGIPQEDLSRIFERFYRVEKSRSKDKGGTGLGLAIVKHILEAHNQKITVTSTVGKGSVFRFGLEASVK
ncbi:MAG TPA: ATP-binding protein [Cyclobacteriaceae bacterium]|nr:ATP-binding protein [Cyclobacteriaceae bacterium]